MKSCFNWVLHPSAPAPAASISASSIVKAWILLSHLALVSAALFLSFEKAVKRSRAQTQAHRSPRELCSPTRVLSLSPILLQFLISGGSGAPSVEASQSLWAQVSQIAPFLTSFVFSAHLLETAAQ